ncbi:MAG: HXXEE domain-containing protein [Spirochaetes bacterium]|nr:HXXEE domain-containing protein [Spirochaetota bacterium]
MTMSLQRLRETPYRKIVWLCALSETLHNIEEAIWLPGWSRSAGPWHPPVSPFEFRFAVAVITLAVYGVILYFVRRETRPARLLMGGTLVVILVNVFIPHLAATIVTARYAPGVLMGVIFNIPVTFYLLRRGLKEGEYSAASLALGTLACTLLAAPIMLASFAMGRWMEQVLF